MTAITARAIADYQRARHAAGKANRTINMDVGVLSRVLKSCGRWRAVADHVRNLPERQQTIGRALTPEERQRLFASAASNPEWEHVYCAAMVAANTSMRPVQVKHLRRRDVDLHKKLVYVRRSKNQTSHRVIPLNAPAIAAIARMLERGDLLGHDQPDHFLWPACQRGRHDPARPVLMWDTAWRALREHAGLGRLRSTTCATRSSPSLRSWASPTTSSSRSAATSRAGCSSTTRTSASTPSARRSTHWTRHAGGPTDGGSETDDRDGGTTGDAPEPAENAQEIPLVVALAEEFTSQSRHSLRLAGSPPSAKLLIPLDWRDVRVVEGARLEIDSARAC
jgi:integrase